MEYTPTGLLKRFTSPSGAASQMEYDAHGRLVRDEDAEQGVKTLTRMANKDVVLETAEGRSWRYGWRRNRRGEWSRQVSDLGAGTTSSSGLRADGSLVSEDALGTKSTAKISADPRWGRHAGYASASEQRLSGGRVFKQRAKREAELDDPEDPMSWTTLRTRAWAQDRGPWVTELERGSRRLAQTSPMGRTSWVVYDAQGRLSEHGAPGVEPTRYVYDDQGRMIESAQGARRVAVRYGADGLVEELEDGLGRVTTMRRDVVGRPVEVVEEATGRAWSQGYDEAGRLVSMQPPGRDAHTWSYSPVGCLLSSALPQVAGMLAQLLWRYDRDGLLIETTLEDGAKVSAEHDAAGRMVRSTQGTITRRFVYGASSGQLERVEREQTGAIELEWEGPLLRAVQWSGPHQISQELEYDSAGLLSLITLGDGPQLELEYDADGLAVRVGELELGWAEELARLEQLRAGSCERSLSYDGYGLPELVEERCAGAERWSEALEYDALGRVSASVERISGGASVRREHRYDEAGRLHQVVRDGQVVSTYLYDAHDNRISRQPASGAAELGEHDEQDRLVRYGGREYSHDARGRVTSWSQGGQTTRLEWDEESELVGVVLPSGQRIDYTLDVMGRRALVSVDGVVTQRLVYSGLQLVAELDAAGQVQTRYVYATHEHVPELMWRGGQWYRLIKDVRGSVRLVVNAQSGAVAQRLDYDEFGRVLTDTAPGFQPFGFAGGVYDHRSALVLFGFRSYDPFSGRFLTRDPLWHGGGHSNLYLYVANDPVNFIDPDGLLPVWVAPTAIKLAKVILGATVIVGVPLYIKGRAIQNQPLSGEGFQNEVQNRISNWEKIIESGTFSESEIHREIMNKREREFDKTGHWDPVDVCVDHYFQGKQQNNDWIPNFINEFFDIAYYGAKSISSSAVRPVSDTSRPASPPTSDQIYWYHKGKGW